MSLSLLKQCGPKRQKALNQMGISSLKDLVDFFPRKYEDRRELTPYDKWLEGQFVIVEAEVLNVQSLNRGKSRTVVEVDVVEGPTLSMVYFGKAGSFVNSKLIVGQKIWVSGTLQSYNGWQIVHPEFQHTKGKKYSGKILPIYSQSEVLQDAGVTQKKIRDWIKQGFENLQSKLLGGELVEFKLPSLRVDYQGIHFPKDFDQIKSSWKNFKIREIIPLAKEMSQQKLMLKKDKKALDLILIQDEISSLPFDLTDDQIHALKSIASSMNEEKQLNALLQADVGAGKTLVALLCAKMQIYFDYGSQVAMLAPTEVLASQLFKEAQKLFSLNEVAYLSGSLNQHEKRRNLNAVQDGSAKIVVGTHAVFQEKVSFKKLEFIIIDEQHRFGVEQRESLIQKGECPDVLMMSATPIPRSLVETFYGHLQKVVMKSKPANRKVVNSRMVPQSKFSDMLKYFDQQVRTGELIFWVLPKIEGDEGANVFQRAEFLKKKGFKVDILHGRMKDEEKASSIKRFRSKETQILVSTTVIEVGVDIPEANIICIEEAHYFGLSQLHQLRGRVGRGGGQGWCFLTSDNEEASERLAEFVTTNDGFDIADLDLKYRGAGDLLGKDQSGWSNLRWTDFYKDIELIKEVMNKTKR